MDHRCHGGRRGRPASRRRPSPWVVLALVVSFSATGPAGAGQTFEGQGRITAIDPGRGTVTLEHGVIPGLLPVGRSEFPVAAGVSIMRSVRPGDRVRFTLAVPDESHGLLTVTALAPEVAAASVVWSDRLMTTVAALLSLLSLGATVVVGVALWRAVQTLQARVVALDHEAGMLRGMVTDTQDGIRQVARALEDAATTLRMGYVRELRRRLGTAPSPGAAPPTRAPGEPASALVVVQRGRGDLYHAVQTEAAGGWTVIWDRRRAERRTGGLHPLGAERRRGERRASPPETWTRLGFHLVSRDRAETARPVHALRSASGERGGAH